MGVRERTPAVCVTFGVDRLRMPVQSDLLLTVLLLLLLPRLPVATVQTYQGAVDMLDSVYVKTGGTEKCFSSSGSGHASGETIQLRQVSTTFCRAPGCGPQLTAASSGSAGCAASSQIVTAHC